MAFRVVDKSSISFETDLPPLLRNIHPSGVLHAFCCDQATSDAANEHVFAWVQNSLKANKILNHLEQTGFHRSRGIVFIPYSTKENWTRRYPYAPLAVQCTEEGKVETCSTEEVTGDCNENGAATAGASSVGVEDKGGRDTKKRKYKCKTSMVGDLSLLPDPERDELHVEIFNYLTWLHKKMAAIEDEKMADLALGIEADSDRYNDNTENGNKPRGKKRKRKRCSPDVDVPELRGALDKLESTFHIIPNIKYEGENEGEGLDPDRELDSAQKGVPFLEEALGPALTQLVDARVLAGRPRRRSRRKKPKPQNPKMDPGRYDPARFEEMIERLERFKEEHGHCRVPYRFKDDPELASWVSQVREAKKIFEKRGAKCVGVGRDRKLTAVMLDAERIERLDAMGFTWEIRGPRKTWEDHFRQLMEYYEEHGKWPPRHQSTGSLGNWIHRQRKLWVTNDEDFMKNRAPMLDEVGFEWTPRGYYLINWDEGFDKLMAFGQANGHFDVPCPAGEEGGDGDVTNKNTDAYKFYKWVESLHTSYRSFKLGRQSGSLTEERIVLLTSCGFTFRDE